MWPYRGGVGSAPARGTADSARLPCDIGVAGNWWRARRASSRWRRPAAATCRHRRPTCTRRCWRPAVAAPGTCPAEHRASLTTISCRRWTRAMLCDSWNHINCFVTLRQKYTQTDRVSLSRAVLCYDRRTCSKLYIREESGGRARHVDRRKCGQRSSTFDKLCWQQIATIDVPRRNFQKSKALGKFPEESTFNFGDSRIPMKRRVGQPMPKSARSIHPFRYNSDLWQE